MTYQRKSQMKNGLQIKGNHGNPLMSASCVVVMTSNLVALPCAYIDSEISTW